jgi:hypothetical protein
MNWPIVRPTGRLSSCTWFGEDPSVGFDTMTIGRGGDEPRRDERVESSKVWPPQKRIVGV